MNKKIRRMIQEIERRGGMINLSGSLPDDLAERFLLEVLSCPDCCAHGLNNTERDPDTGIRVVTDTSLRPRHGH
jgi:hypothetical protein